MQKLCRQKSGFIAASNCRVLIFKKLNTCFKSDFTLYMRLPKSCLFQMSNSQAFENIRDIFLLAVHHPYLKMTYNHLCRLVNDFPQTTSILDYPLYYLPFPTERKSSCEVAVYWSQYRCPHRTNILR